MTIRTRQAVEKPLVNIKNGVAGAKPPYRLSAICATASCSGFVWLTASILAWSRGGSPSNIAPARMPGVYAARLCRTQSQPSIHSPLPWGKGFGDRDRGFALSYKKQTFSTSKRVRIMIIRTRYLYPLPKLKQYP